MKFHYHPETDSLYIHLTERASVESEEVAPDIVFDYDADGVVVGIDIDNASRLVNMQHLEIDFPQVQTLLAA